MYEYRPIRAEELQFVYRRIEAENLFWCLDCEYQKPDFREWMQKFLRKDVLMVGGFVDGDFAGVLMAHGISQRSRCAEIGVCGFHKYFGEADALARGAMLYLFDNYDCTSALGRIAVPNLHALRMLDAVGFSRVARVKDMFWYERKGKYVDGIIVYADAASVESACTAEERYPSIAQ